MKRDLNIAHVMQKLAFCMSGILIAFAPSYAFAERPEVDCADVMNDDALSNQFFELSGMSAQAAQEKNYDEALAYASKCCCAVVKRDRDEPLHLGKVHAHRCFELIGQDNVGVVAVTLHINNFRTIKP